MGDWKLGEKKRRLLMPQYMAKFRCIGNECEDSCCVGWRVTIDEETYKKYRRVKEPELAGMFAKHVGRNRSQPSPAEHARVRMKKDGRCPFLTGESLCLIQLRLGEEYLSNTCYTYPRTVNEVNGVLERSATMSCPEAARLALLNPEPMEFDLVEEMVPERTQIKTKVDSRALAAANRPVRYFWEIRELAVDILQNRALPLDDRMVLLGMFCRRLGEAVEGGQVQEIPGIVDEYRRVQNDKATAEMLAGVPTQVELQVKLAKELADERFAEGISSARYLENFAWFLAGVGCVKGASFEDVAVRYRSAYEDYFVPFVREHGYILENYLVNYVFRSLFPFDQKDIFDAFVMLAVHYAMIKLQLVGVGAFHKGLTQKLALRVIQAFAKTVEHNTAYLTRIIELLTAGGYNTLPWMAILMKN
ncbi:flagellin lysine-N-methylase [Syntrophothermus lipocalidus]|nr:flagellin lysine-N-methylase [Syntrophothermus lipocalidus]